ncbi:MAG: S8 family serine peptidase [Phenylobacterium sp.]
MAGERQVRSLIAALCLCAAAAWARPGAAQILGGLPGLPGGGLPGGILPPAARDLPGRDALPPRVRKPRAPVETPALPSVTGPVNSAVGVARELADAPLSEVRRLTAERLLREHPEQVEADDHGQPVVRGEVLRLEGDAASVERLRQAGFSVRADDDLRPLGLHAQVIGLPRGVSAIEAVRRLRALDPGGQYDFNHLYQESGVSTGGGGGTASPAVDGRSLRIGMVDGSAAADAPALARARLTQRAFGPGGARVTGHATAVASLIVGWYGPFHGAAPGASLYVADVYGPTAAGGSAEAVARGLAWLAQTGAPVVSISLVGPTNRLLEASVQALIARGRLVVAAVGNDGPAAPPLYPAGYPGVVAVTGVDARDRVLPEAGRGTHVDFAAPGSDMAAAGASGGFVSVRGSSFAAPIVAGRLAALASRASPAEAVAALGREAVDLGAPGPDPIYGRGLVGADIRTEPAAVGAGRTPLAANR